MRFVFLPYTHVCIHIYIYIYIHTVMKRWFFFSRGPGGFRELREGVRAPILVPLRRRYRGYTAVSMFYIHNMSGSKS